MAATDEIRLSPLDQATADPRPPPERIDVERRELPVLRAGVLA
jgi:hypothetical protein